MSLISVWSPHFSQPKLWHDNVPMHYTPKLACSFDTNRMDPKNTLPVLWGFHKLQNNSNIFLRELSHLVWGMWQMFHFRGRGKKISATKIYKIKQYAISHILMSPADAFSISTARMHSHSLWTHFFWEYASAYLWSVLYLPASHCIPTAFTMVQQLIGLLY